MKLKELKLKIIIPKKLMDLLKDLDLDYITTKRLEDSGSMKLWSLSDNIIFELEEDKYNVYPKELIEKINKIIGVNK
ncbi:MAG: hypothetical protein ACFFG0_51050 [Candidatus Thorarchaeota archaeon]